MAVTMKNTVLVHMTPYSLVEMYRSFGGKYFSLLQRCSGDRDHSSEISANFCQTIVFLVPTWITNTIYYIQFKQRTCNLFESCALLGYYAAYSDNSLPTFRGNLSRTSLRVTNLRSNPFYREHRDTLQLHHAADVLRYSSHYLDSHEILRIFLWIFGLQSVKKCFRLKLYA